MSSAGRLLVVDDHPEIRDALEAFLSRRGFSVQAVGDVAAARSVLAGPDPIDLVVLDVMLPGESGLALCRELQAADGPPVILLSALAQPVQRVTGLEQGADDYVVKPFDPNELAARVRTVLRRRGPPPAAGAAAWVYHFAGWTFDLRAATLAHDDGRRQTLSATEVRLLNALVRRPGEVLSRERLLDLCSGEGGGEVYDRSIDSQVSRLRRKLERDPRRPALLRTAWGDGYLLAVEVERRPLAAAVEAPASASASASASTSVATAPAAAPSPSPASPASLAPLAA